MFLTISDMMNHLIKHVYQVHERIMNIYSMYYHNLIMIYIYMNVYIECITTPL